MLIVVSGLDTYRSLERARFLESAYRQKYDQTGSSIERLPFGKDAIDPLLSICVSGSLFSSRRFIRADGIVSACPKAKREALLKALAHDSESTIVLCREDGALKDADLKGFSSLSGFKHDRFDLLDARAFHQWAFDRAESIGFTDQNVVRKIADASNGDSWAFISELGKVSCGGEALQNHAEDVTVYGVIDSLAQDHARRITFRLQADDDEGVVALAPQQARSMLLIESGCTEGIHPFVVQKNNRIHCKNKVDFFERMFASYLWSRSGLSTAEEALDILE